MTAPNPSTLWGRLIVAELAAQGVDTVCVAPGSRSTPIVVAAAAHPDLRTYSILDERAAAYFAVGRGKATGEPTVVVTTSGTGAVNLHPAVVEADRSRTPLVVCTADRPPERHGAGANQTIDQRDLFGGAVRFAPDLPDPGADAGRQTALRNRVARAVHRAVGPVPGPVHLNVPLRKPLEPTPTEEELAVAGEAAWPPSSSANDRTVTERRGRPTLEKADRDALADAISDAERPLIVAGPSDRLPSAALVAWSGAAQIPVAADPLSGVRFGAGDAGAPILGGYDGWLEPAVRGAVDPPDLVLRFGARPTSTALQTFLSRADARDVLVDPAADYRDPTHTADEVVAAAAGPVLEALASRVEHPVGDEAWRDRVCRLERAYWELVAADSAVLPPEGRVAAAVFDGAPAGASVFVSNSTPIRDVDRFGRPTAVEVTAIGNRGASGIDGITSTGLGVASASDGPTVLLTGDLAFYHDMTGLFTAQRCEIDATIVVINNDGGGIFHMLPIEDWDPPFTEHFKTPHGLQFGALADLYDLPYSQVEPAGFPDAYETALGTDGPAVIEVAVDAAEHHRRRESFQELVRDRLASVD